MTKYPFKSDAIKSAKVWAECTAELLFGKCKKYRHVAKCVNSIRKGRFKPELAQKKEYYFGHKMEINFTELGCIVCFPEENIKLFCDSKCKCVNYIQFNL